MRRAVAPAAVVVVAFFAVAAVSGFRTKLVLGVFTSSLQPLELSRAEMQAEIASRRRRHRGNRQRSAACVTL
jgi:hypothetical protein